MSADQETADLTKSPYTGYPVLLRLEGQRCIVVGGGKVAARKVPDLVAAGAKVIVISPALDPRLASLSTSGTIEVRAYAYQSGMLAAVQPAPLLVFAATNSSAVNQQVADEAKSLHILVDQVDSGTGSDFSSMAVIRRGPLTLGIATGGASPALIVHLRKRLTATIGPEYGTLAEWLAELRPSIRQQIASEGDRQRIWQSILESPVLDHLRNNDPQTARAILDKLVAVLINQNK